MKDYAEWVKTLKLDMDNGLTEKEYLEKRDREKKHKKEIQYHREVANYAANSILANIYKAIESVNVMIAVALNQLKVKKPEVYAELNIKEFITEGN